jgi:hypothetical protein
MNSGPPSCLCSFALAVLISLGCFSGLALEEDFRGEESQAGGGPHLVIASVYGNLELGRPSSIFVALENRAEQGADEDDRDLRREAARSISAQLISSDERIRILSSPQFGGLLEGGANATLQLTALAEGIPLGLYPLELRCNFSWLSGVTATGSETAPSLFFEYAAASQDLPMQVEVVMGPRVEIEVQDEWLNYVAPGKESSLELTLTNRGDEPARDLELQVRPLPPIMMVESAWVQASLSPGESAEARLSLFAEENASPRYYALPCLVTYNDGLEEGKRREEKAAVIYVGQRISSAWIYLAGAALAGILLLSALLVLEKIRRSRRRFRIVKS